MRKNPQSYAFIVSTAFRRLKLQLINKWPGK